MSDSTGENTTAPAAHSFTFEVGQQVIYRRGEPNQYDAKIHGRWIDDKGVERYSLLSVPGGYLVNTGVIVSHLSAITPVDRTRLGVESLGWGKAEEIPGTGGAGHRVAGRIDPSEGYADESGD